MRDQPPESRAPAPLLNRHTHLGEAGSDGRLQLAAVTHNELFTSIRANAPILDCAMHPIRESACAVAPKNMLPCLGELEEGALHSLVAVSNPPFRSQSGSCVTYSPDGSAVVFGNDDGLLGVLDSELGELWCTRAASHSSGVLSLRTSATTNCLLALCADSTVACFGGLECTTLRNDQMTGMFTTCANNGLGSRAELGSLCFAFGGSVFAATEFVTDNDAYQEKQQSRLQSQTERQYKILAGNRRASKQSEWKDEGGEGDDIEYEFVQRSTVFIFSATTGDLLRVNEGQLKEGPGDDVVWLSYIQSLLCLTRSGYINVWSQPKRERWSAFDPSFEYLTYNRHVKESLNESDESADLGCLNVDESINDEQKHVEIEIVENNKGMQTQIGSEEDRVRQPKKAERERSEEVGGEQQTHDHERNDAMKSNSRDGGIRPKTRSQAAEQSAGDDEETNPEAEQVGDEVSELVEHLPIHESIAQRNWPQKEKRVNPKPSR